MALSLRAGQTQTQTLNPAMWMGLSLLAMPSAELKDAVRKEIDSNPALEEVERRCAGRPSSAAGSAVPIESLAADDSVSLDEHLTAELRMSEVGPREFALCSGIIAELDEDGRFTGTIPDLMMVTGASESELESARRRVMALDPPGCGAKDLAECFLAQISLVPPSKRELFEREVPHIASGRVSKELLPVLRRLDPFPGRLYAPNRTRYVQADIFVDEDGDVTVDTSDLPETRVSPKYVEMAKDRTLDAETRAYAAERVKRAREFRAAVERRLETVGRIAEMAISFQHEALKKGMSAMKPLTMSEIARKAKCSVATVSRAAARKYVKTPFGTVPLAGFFQRTDSARMACLREIIESAPAGETLSDRIIAEKMAKAGYKTARRTVAKYRARLGLAAKGKPFARNAGEDP